MSNIIAEPIETTATTSDPGDNPGSSEQPQQPEPRRLVRGEGPMAGVAGGLADYFNLDPTLVRLGIIGVALVTFPLGPIAYAAAWLIMPEA